MDRELPERDGAPEGGAPAQDPPPSAGQLVKGTVLKRERVRDVLLALVEARRPGDAIPSERSLCARLGVSRPTLRAAVDELVATGLLVREHGRGMFVAPAKITQEMAADGDGFLLPPASGRWTSRVLEFTTVQAGARVGRRLRLSPAAEITYIARLRLVEGVPMAVEHLHVPAELVPGLTAYDIEAGSFHERLREHYGVGVDQAEQSIEPTVISEVEGRLLGVPVLSPALLFERTTTDDTGRSVEYVRSLYRGDRYRIVSRLLLGDRTRDLARKGAADPGREHHPGIPPGDLGRRDAVASSTTGSVSGGPGR